VNPKFGTAGAGDLFYAQGHKHSAEVPAFLADLGLGAFEYQCGRGVNIGPEKAALLGRNAAEHGIALSIHAPYFITLATDEEEKKKNNLRYFTDSANAARSMGASRIVFHPGMNGKLSKEEAFIRSKDALAAILDKLDALGFGDLIFCPETMGHPSQIGSLDDALSLCELRGNMLPCVDFGHMYARTSGACDGKEAFAAIFEQIEQKLGSERTGKIHCHFSRIEYNRGGEKKHLTFADTAFGPAFEPLIELIAARGYSPTVICESAGTQAQDACAMSAYYNSIH